MGSKRVQPRGASKPQALPNCSGPSQDQGEDQKPPEDRKGKKKRAAELLGER